MKKMCTFFVGFALLWFNALCVHAAEFGPNSAGWQLVKQNANGDFLYLAPAEGNAPSSGYKAFWAKVETKAKTSPSPMLFLNEFRCAEGLIKRLEVRLYRLDEGGSPQPFRSISFEGKWDQPAAGIEAYLQKRICGESKGKRL